MQDLISRLLERKPAKRLGMLAGRAQDVKRHKWFEGFDWDALASRRMEAPRPSKDDAAKRIKELAVRALAVCICGSHVLKSRVQLSTRNGFFVQEGEMKQKTKEPKETPEEMQECEVVFADF